MPHAAEQRTRHPSTWAGLATGPLAAALHQQVSSLMLPLSCAQNSGWPTVALGLVLAVVTALAGAASWRARRAEAGRGHDLAPGPGNRRFVATLSAGTAAFFVLVILAQALAGLFLTGCER